ncbi:MAG: putative dehydrogenase [Kiritimatiellia bacterium]|jgi:predicted dehydrogenase
MKKPNNTTRRGFIKKAAATIGAPMIVPSSVLGLNGQVAPSNQIVLGGVGLGPRGRKDLDCFLKQPDVRFVTVADPQKERREIIQRYVGKLYKNQECKPVQDMYEVFQRDDIDAVLIATGDRWHATASMIAAQHGKDIYSEKPCTMTIRESQELDEVILHTGRVFQAGTQRRSVDNFKVAANLAQSGKLGNLTSVYAGILKLEADLPWLPGEPEPDPSEIDWNRWLGPAPWRPYNQLYCRGRWRGHHGLATGYKLLEWGSHTIDLCQWAAKADGTTPIEFEAINDTTVHAKYANGVKLIMRLAGFKGEGDWKPGLGSCPIRFEGDEGWVEAGDFGKIEVSDPKLLEGVTYDAELYGTDPIKHVRNFLDCVKSREPSTCNSTVARYGHVAGHAAAISWKLGRKMTFDPATESFVGDEEANRMRSRARRAPWHV